MVATVERKEVVVALLGASAALAGLVLVFLGFIVSTIQSFQSYDPARTVVLRSYRVLASVIASAFLAGIGVIALSTWWLAGGQHKALYGWSVVGFAVQLALLAVSAGWVLVVFIWKG